MATLTSKPAVVLPLSTLESQSVPSIAAVPLAALNNGQVLIAAGMVVCGNVSPVRKQ